MRRLDDVRESCHDSSKGEPTCSSGIMASTKERHHYAK